MSSPCSRGDTVEERSPSRLPRFPVFLYGAVEWGEKRQMFRERRGALPFPAAPTETGGGRVGRGKSRSHFVQLTRRCERSPSGRQPKPKKGIRKFSLGRNRGRRLAHAHLDSQRRGRAAGGHNLAWRGAFVLRTRPPSLQGFGSSSSPRGAQGLPPGVGPQRCAGGGLRPEWSQRWVFRSLGLEGWSGPPVLSCNLHL